MIRRVEYRQGRIKLSRAAREAIGLTVGAPAEFLIDRATGEFAVRRMRGVCVICGDPEAMEAIGPRCLTVCKSCCRAASQRR